MSGKPHTSSSDDVRNEWGPCPDGTVTRLVGKLQHRKRIHRVKRATVVAGSLLMLIVAGRFLVTPSTPPPRLSHHEVTQLAGQYIRGELNEEQTELVEAHIDVCPQCLHLREDRRAYLENTNSQTALIREKESNLLAHSH